jgi:tight adherence protein B
MQIDPILILVIGCVFALIVLSLERRIGLSERSLVEERLGRYVETQQDVPTEKRNQHRYRWLNRRVEIPHWRPYQQDLARAYLK